MFGRNNFIPKKLICFLHKFLLKLVETNWRNMVETSDGLETSENEILKYNRIIKRKC